MEVMNSKRTTLHEAKRRVARIKSFYSHLVVFVVINGALMLLKDEMTVAIFGQEALGDSRLMSWVDINAYIWIGILTIHAIIVFGGIQSSITKWEERQVEKIMQKDRVKKYE